MELESLDKIQKVAAPASLKAKVMLAVESDSIGISMPWLRAAAAVAVLLLATELFVAANSMVKADKSSLESLVPNTTNDLYNE